MSALARIGRRRTAWIGALVALVLAVGLAAVASFPTGAPGPTDVVPSGARVAAVERAGDAHVLLTVDGGHLVLRVAYRGEKGWHDVAADPVAGDSPAALTATSGGGGVPSLSAVYGRSPGERAVVVWADGVRRSVDLARDGSYLVVRTGRHGVAQVAVVAADGSTVTEVTDL